MDSKRTYQEQTLFDITWPLFIELSLHLGMGIMATLMLSHYSDAAASGVGVSNQILNIFILVFNVTAIGGTILISQSLGAQRLDHAQKLSCTVFGLNFWFGLIVSAIVFLFGRFFLGLFHVHGAVYAYGLTFIHISGASLILESLSLALSSILRSYGFTKQPMLVTVTMDLISIIGNIFATTGPFGLPVTGVVGVSWAMVIARLFAVLALLYFINRQLALRFKWTDMIHLDKKNIRGLLAIGIPSAGENLSYQLSQLVITGIAVSVGAAALAARVYIMNICMICYLFTLAIAQGTQLLVARYVGGRQHEKAVHRGLKTLKISMLVSLVVSLCIAIIGEPVLKIFTNDPQILLVGVPVLWAVAFTEPGRAMNIVLMGALKSTGDVRFPVVIGIFSMWTFAVGLSYILGVTLEFGLFGIWMAQGTDEWFRGIFAWRRWLSMPWLRKTTIKQHANHPA
ncbi:MATE family efflux transporter [Tuberibacillus calidus]|uniref:MATE family efflux transporter n=1 Tax=Tuberibacillus calidus TaxID=340097 RepID=UPI0004031C4D|nr:MATE family efflux transporter [Tuberibacillus calidus]